MADSNIFCAPKIYFMLFFTCSVAHMTLTFFHSVVEKFPPHKYFILLPKTVECGNFFTIEKFFLEIFPQLEICSNMAKIHFLGVSIWKYAKTDWIWDALLNKTINKLLSWLAEGSRQPHTKSIKWYFWSTIAVVVNDGLDSGDTCQTFTFQQKCKNFANSCKTLGYNEWNMVKIGDLWNSSFSIWNIIVLITFFNVRKMGYPSTSLTKGK